MCLAYKKKKYKTIQQYSCRLQVTLLNIYTRTYKVYTKNVYNE